jgi:hypothetical protein
MQIFRLLKMSTRKGPELHMEIFRLQKPMLLLDLSTLKRPVLVCSILDVSVKQGPELSPFRDI